MSDRVQELRQKVTLLRRLRGLLLFGVSALVSVLWVRLISEQFVINSAAIKSAVFVFVVTFLPLALAHAFTLAIYQQRLADAERDARVPKAVVHSSSN